MQQRAVRARGRRARGDAVRPCVLRQRVGLGCREIEMQIDLEIEIDSYIDR